MKQAAAEEFEAAKQEVLANPLSVQQEVEVRDRYGRIFHPQNLDNLTKEDFKSFLLFKNNHHWSGIFRSNNLVTDDMDRLRSALRILLDESRPLRDRLEKLFPKKGPNYIKGLGKAIVTPILLVVYPDKYGVWNEPSQKGLMELGLFPAFNRGDGFADKYLKINDVLIGLKDEHGLSFWQLDWVLGSIANQGFAPREEVEDEIEQEAEITPAQAGKDYDKTEFGLEAHLEAFLIENWERIELGKHYTILEEDGDVVGQQYGTDVGPIDILARSKNGSEWLVIELKKGKPSDRVIGQILRYMGWVKANKAAADEAVKGLIVLKSKDSKLEYSASMIPDITIMTYSVNFTLNND